jgi:hypothetical protein
MAERKLAVVGAEVSEAEAGIGSSVRSLTGAVRWEGRDGP